MRPRLMCGCVRARHCVCMEKLVFAFALDYTQDCHSRLAIVCSWVCKENAPFGVRALRT